ALGVHVGTDGKRSVCGSAEGRGMSSPGQSHSIGSEIECEHARSSGYLLSRLQAPARATGRAARPDRGAASQPRPLATATGPGAEELLDVVQAPVLGHRQAAQGPAPSPANGPVHRRAAPPPPTTP